jgi:excisionase family DNA binding protein
MRMLTVKEVAKILQMSPAMIYREIHLGNLRSFCFGKRCYRVAKEDLEHYVKEHAVSGQPRPRQREEQRPKRKGLLRHVGINRPP